MSKPHSISINNIKSIIPNTNSSIVANIELKLSEQREREHKLDINPLLLNKMISQIKTHFNNTDNYRIIKTSQNTEKKIFPIPFDEFVDGDYFVCDVFNDGSYKTDPNKQPQTRVFFSREGDYLGRYDRDNKTSCYWSTESAHSINGARVSDMRNVVFSSNGTLEYKGKCVTTNAK